MFGTLLRLIKTSSQQQQDVELGSIGQTASPSTGVDRLLPSTHNDTINRGRQTEIARLQDALAETQKLLANVELDYRKLETELQVQLELATPFPVSPYPTAHLDFGYPVHSSTILYYGQRPDINGEGGYSVNALLRAQAWSWHAEAVALGLAIAQKKAFPMDPVNARRTSDGRFYEWENWDVGKLQQRQMFCLERGDCCIHKCDEEDEKKKSSKMSWFSTSSPTTPPIILFFLQILLSAAIIALIVARSRKTDVSQKNRAGRVTTASLSLCVVNFLLTPVGLVVLNWRKPFTAQVWASSVRYTSAFGFSMATVILVAAVTDRTGHDNTL